MPTTYAIPNGRTVFDAPIWTGVSTSSAITISTLQFQPDLVWGKARSVGYTHGLADSVRGISAGRLQSNSTATEVAPASFAYGSVSAFNSNGFTTSPGSTDNENWNETGQTYVAWCWQANGAAVTNNVGSISSQVSANTTAGFSIVTYTGNSVTSASVGHGLGATPSLIFIKRRDTTAQDWGVYNVIGGLKLLQLNTTSSYWSGASNYWYSVPSSTVFYPDNTAAGDHYQNISGATYVAYCWTPIAGFSQFGSYTGNGDVNGPFIYTGFRPKFLLIKRTDAARNWFIYDTSRSPYNATLLELEPNLSDAETTSAGSLGFDLLSNGIKVRTNQSAYNESTATYIYAAFAENPFKYANAR